MHRVLRAPSIRGRRGGGGAESVRCGAVQCGRAGVDEEDEDEGAAVRVQQAKEKGRQAGMRMRSYLLLIMLASMRSKPGMGASRLV